jgi:hypothetical protein
MKARHFYALAACVMTAVLPARAGPAEEWVAKARSYLGSESALNAVKSLHFQGTIEVVERIIDPTDSSKTIERPIHLGIDIVFQKPMQQRQILRSEKIERTTTLDGYDAWEKVTDLSKPASPRIYLLDPAGIKRLRATTIENLSFYSNQGHDSRQIRLLGDATVEGVACVKLSFMHGSSIVFLRYFDKSSGRLVKTEVESGGEIREEGELMSSGIRFPRKVLNKSPEGKVTSISFDKVTVNESVPAEIFAVPSAQPK